MTARARSTWRTVRMQEASLQRRLQQRHHLRLHGWCIGLAVVLGMWGVSHLQMVLGNDSLAVRYLVTLGAGYLLYLLLLRIWAGMLVDRPADIGDPGGDLIVEGLPDIGSVQLPMPEAGFGAGGGGGGDFGGGGASAAFDADLSPAAESAVGEVASGALEVAAGADEGAIVVVPVVAVFLVGVAVLFGAGSLLLLYFGWEALLAVAVELAFGYVGARTAVKIGREGWLGAAVRLTWKPLLGALACAVLLGAMLDIFVPQARSLPHAVALWRASP
jgi:hypothetical protein